MFSSSQGSIPKTSGLMEQKPSPEQKGKKSRFLPHENVRSGIVVIDLETRCDM